MYINVSGSFKYRIVYMYIHIQNLYPGQQDSRKR